MSEKNEKFLRGKTILLTRSVAGNARWAKELKKYGAVVYSLSTIEVNALPISSETKAAFADISSFDWLIFTSAAGVRSCAALLKNVQERLPRIAVIGSETARSFGEIGLAADFQPSQATATTLAIELEPVKGKKILLLQGNRSSKELAYILKDRGAVVTALSVYETRLIEKADPAADHLFAEEKINKKIDYIVFASPSAVLGFSKQVQKISTALAIAIGPTTAAALTKNGFKNIHVATEPSIKGVINKLRDICYSAKHG